MRYQIAISLPYYQIEPLATVSRNEALLDAAHVAIAELEMLVNGFSTMESFADSKGTVKGYWCEAKTPGDKIIWRDRCYYLVSDTAEDPDLAELCALLVKLSDKLARIYAERGVSQSAFQVAIHHGVQAISPY